MLHAHTGIWIHVIWGSHKHERILLKEPGSQIYNFLMEKSKENKVPFDRLNIQPEHIHGLINIPSNICLADFIYGIKGASSHWINNQKLFKTHFSWSRGYGAFSVSASQLKVVRKYIMNQSEHHRINTYMEEYKSWKEEYGIFED